MRKLQSSRTDKEILVLFNRSFVFYLSASQTDTVHSKVRLLLCTIGLQVKNNTVCHCFVTHKWQGMDGQSSVMYHTFSMVKMSCYPPDGGTAQSNTFLTSYNRDPLYLPVYRSSVEQLLVMWRVSKYFPNFPKDNKQNLRNKYDATAKPVACSLKTHFYSGCEPEIISWHNTILIPWTMIW